MEIRQLRYFAQIVESGSLSKASRSLFVAQPALSQQIAKLESEVGKPLLIRSARGVQPTESGFALYHHARFMLRQFDQALAIARQGSADMRGMVSVGLPSTTLAAIGLPLVRRIRSNYPGILLNIVESLSGHLSQMMRLGQLDVAILFNSDVSSDLEAVTLLDEELVVLLPKTSLLVSAERTSLTIREVAALPLVLPAGTHGLRRSVAAVFEDRNLKAQIIAEIDSLCLLMQCVFDGLGATIKPRSALQAEASQREKWRVLPVHDVKLSRRNYLYSVTPDMLSPAAAAVRNELRDLARELCCSGHWEGVTMIGQAAGSAKTKLARTRRTLTLGLAVPVSAD